MEFALVVPLLLLLVLGAVEIGRAAYYAIAVVNAARSAVQYGARNSVTAGDDNGIKQAALNDFPMLSPDNVTIDTSHCECPNGNLAPNCVETDCPVDNRFIPYLKVNTQMQIMPLVGFPGLPPSFSFTGEAIMRIGN